MRRDRFISVVIGVVAFGLAHALITGTSFRATLTPDPMIRPWFTNSGGSVLLTAALVALAAFAIALGAADRRSAMMRGATVGVGAIVAMFAVMLQMGIGTLGPIAFVVGGAVLLAAGTAGGGGAAALKN